jgi:tryptophan synthase beta subunit
MGKLPNHILFRQIRLQVLAYARQSLRNRKSTIYLNYRRTSDAVGTKTKMEGIIPAIETAHAFAVLDEMKFKPEDIVVIIYQDVATKI